MKITQYLTFISILCLLSLSEISSKTVFNFVPFVDIQQLRNINWNGSSTPRNYTACGGQVFFSARDNSHGYELWKTDGTEAGTVMVKDIDTTGDGNGLSQYGTEFVCFKSRLYFTAYDDDHGGELFVSNGTAAGTYMLLEISPGSWSSSYPSKFYNHNNELLYFQAFTAATGFEPWVTNGTPGGTRMLRDIRSNEGATFDERSSFAQGFMALGNYVYFMARDGENNRELWVTNGTMAGTMMLLDINPGGNGVVQRPLTLLNDRLYFSATDGINGTELWSTDGSPGGTAMVRDINPYAGHSAPMNFITFRAGKLKATTYLYFTAYNPASGRELWRSDGTTAGTQLFQDLDNAGSSSPENFTASGNYLYFTARTPAYGRELWRSNGSSPATLVQDIHPGPTSSFNNSVDDRHFVNFGSRLIFAANDGTNGNELWRSEGSPADTYLLRNINPGASHSSPYNLYVSGQRLYFGANNHQAFEPWVYYDPNVPVIIDIHRF